MHRLTSGHAQTDKQKLRKEPSCFVAIKMNKRTNT